MIVPAVGGLASNLSESVTKGIAAQATGGPAQGAGTGIEGVGGLEGAGGAAGTAGVTGTTGVSGTAGVEGTAGIEGTAGSGGSGGGFGNALTSAISSLESTQLSADSAAQSLATGTASDPESAVVTVEDAQMAMDLAAQIRSKAAEAAQNIFQTQV